MLVHTEQKKVVKVLPVRLRITAIDTDLRSNVLALACKAGVLSSLQKFELS
jgi:hypothetical protein